MFIFSKNEPATTADLSLDLIYGAMSEEKAELPKKLSKNQKKRKAAKKKKEEEEEKKPQEVPADVAVLMMLQAQNKNLMAACGLLVQMVKNQEETNLHLKAGLKEKEDPIIWSQLPEE